MAVEMAKQRVCTKFKSVDGTTHLIEELRLCSLSLATFRFSTFNYIFFKRTGGQKPY